MFYDACSPEQQGVVEWATDKGLKATHHCDGYAFTVYPEGHADYWVGEYMYAYWMRQWGFDRSDAFKGIIVLELASKE